MEKKASLPKLMHPSPSVVISESNISQAVTEQHQSQVEALKDLQQESKMVEAMEQREAERLESQLNKATVKRSIINNGGAAANKSTPKDEKDVKIDKLKQVNIKLRQRLKELNGQLEKTIEKANSRKIQKSLQVMSAAGANTQSTTEAAVEHQVRIKERELKNAQTQVELYRRELQQLQTKVDDLSGVDRLLQLETKLRDGMQERTDLEKKVRELERQHKEQGKALERMANEEEFQAKMKCLVDELRIWKEKVKRLETQQEREEQTRKVQQEKIIQVQEENKKYQTVIAELKVKKGITDISESLSQEQVVFKEQELQRLEDEKRTLEQQVVEEEKRQRLELRRWEKKVKGAEDKFDLLQKELRDKEQENRISRLKIKEMKRLIKAHQSKAAGGGAQSQMQLPQNTSLEEEDVEAAEQQQPFIIEKLGNAGDAIFLTGSGAAQEGSPRKEEGGPSEMEKQGIAVANDEQVQQ